MHVFAFFLLLFYILCTDCQTNLDVGLIRALRFAPRTNLYRERRDGVLEVYYNGTWGTICNYGFDELAASVACFMLGYPPRGIPILNSRRQSRLTSVISDFNCTGRIILPFNNPNSATVHLGVCAFTDNLHRNCLSWERQTAVYCLDPMVEKEHTTPEPIDIPFPEVNCSIDNNFSSIIRLVDGTENAGRVEVKHPESGEWGTICADGFDINAARALCRMLCISSDNLDYAYPVLYRYGSAVDSVPIHLARINCPENATNLNDCVLGDGWGATRGCTHGMDIGLQCGPVTRNVTRGVYTPKFECNQTTATIRYEKSANPDMNVTMLRLTGQVPIDCNYTVFDVDDCIEMNIPLTGCGGSLALSNDTSIVVRFEVVRDFFAPADGIISRLPVTFSLTCLIPRSNAIQTETFISPQLTTDLFGISVGMTTSLMIYSDQKFQQPLMQPITVSPGQKIYAVVSLTDTEQSLYKLILEDCWATAEKESTSLPRQDLITSRCAAYDSLTVVPINNTKVGFTFPAFFLIASGSKVPSSTHIYIHCASRVCDMREKVGCQQFCRMPTNITPRRITRHIRW